MEVLTHVLLQEWCPTMEEIMGRWIFWRKLPYSTRKELYIKVIGEGSDRKLLLLSIVVYAESGRGIWRTNCCLQAPQPCSIPSSWWWYHSAYRWLVQVQCNIKLLIHPRNKIHLWNLQRMDMFNFSLPLIISPGIQTYHSLLNREAYFHYKIFHPNYVNFESWSRKYYRNRRKHPNGELMNSIEIKIITYKNTSIKDKK